jgi:exoribonuclease-2
MNLKEVAHNTMIEQGFKPEIPGSVKAELGQLDQNEVINSESARDLRQLLWSSIDNLTSRDLDQVEYAERQSDGGIRVLIGIADVDAFVKKGSATDAYAFENTTSVYTGVTTFPMLPEELSTDATSLLEGKRPPGNCH